MALRTEDRVLLSTDWRGYNNDHIPSLVENRPIGGNMEVEIKRCFI
jgi:hypothetical protein